MEGEFDFFLFSFHFCTFVVVSVLRGLLDFEGVLMLLHVCLWDGELAYLHMTDESLQCFKTGEELVVSYSVTQAFG